MGFLILFYRSNSSAICLEQATLRSKGFRGGSFQPGICWNLRGMRKISKAAPFISRQKIDVSRHCIEESPISADINL